MNPNEIKRYLKIMECQQKNAIVFIKFHHVTYACDLNNIYLIVGIICRNVPPIFFNLDRLSELAEGVRFIASVKI